MNDHTYLGLSLCPSWVPYLELFFGNILPEIVLSYYRFPVIRSIFNSLGSLCTKLLTQNESRVWFRRYLFRRYLDFKLNQDPERHTRLVALQLELIEKSHWHLWLRFYLCSSSKSKVELGISAHMFQEFSTNALTKAYDFLGLNWIWRRRPSCSHACYLLSPPQLVRVPRTFKSITERDGYDW